MKGYLKMTDLEKVQKFNRVVSLLQKNGLDVNIDNSIAFSIQLKDNTNELYQFDTIEELYGFMCGYVYGKYGTEQLI